jgi:hypothetical protein
MDSWIVGFWCSKVRKDDMKKNVLPVPRLLGGFRYEKLLEARQVDIARLRVAPAGRRGRTVVTERESLFAQKKKR